MRLDDSRPSSAHPAPQALAGLAALVGALVVLGHDGRRVAQLLVLFLPALIWLCWPVRSPALRQGRRVLVWTWAALFVLDGAVRGYLLSAYGASPDSALVLGSAANTNPREAGEYFQTHWRALLLWLLTGGAATAGAWWLMRQGTARPSSSGWALGRWSRRLMVLLLCACLLVVAAAYASKPWRRLHPLAFWPGWVASLDQQRESLQNQQQQRAALTARARALAPIIAREGPSTMVLVITDSINRDNMSLYGYERATTPRLAAQARELGGQMLTLRNAWSVDASTVPSLRNIFGFGRPDAPDAQHLLALARSAGYKVWWMSNHDDMAVEQQHALLANEVEFVNRMPGRASASLDGELLDCLQEALEDPTPRKLIVVHLLGAHPHYGLRFPSGQNPFDDAPDRVERQLEAQGRPAWVRRFRQDYDAALLYHDAVVSETLRLARSAGDAQGYRAWMFLSDHGQEVGHERNEVGHSPVSESGYRIPALVWSNDPAFAATPSRAERPFRADWAAWTMADLLHLRWPGQQPAHNVLDGAYRWQAPKLPFELKAVAGR